MVLNSVDLLLDSLRETKLLRAEQLDQLANEIAPRFRDTQEVAKHIIKLGWITLYQGKKLLAGAGHELVLGNYVIVDKIGEGGMGKVYMAKQLRLSRTVALKVIRPNLISNETALKRFHREAKSAGQLTHPNIVRLFDADQIGDRHFLAMEYVEGTDLAKLVKESGPLAFGLASSFIRQAACGLQHAHDLGLVHRDIKPSNLLVTTSKKGAKSATGIIKILDMGLARAIDTEQTNNDVTALTQAGTVIGTPDYMSPEQAKNSSTVDHRSDLYSLGCTFYFLLTGQTPFPKGTTLEKLLQHQMDHPPHVQLLRPEVPDELANIAHTLLAKRPDDRFQSGNALATALEPWSALDADNHRLHGESDTLLPEFVPQALPVTNTTSENTPQGATPADPFDFDDVDSVPAEPPRPKMEMVVNEPPKQKRLLLWVFSALGGLGLLGAAILIAGNLNKKPLPPPPEQTSVKEDSQPQPKKDLLPIKRTELEPLDAYLPADTGIVLVLNMSQLAKSTFFKNQLLPQLEPALQLIRPTVKFDPLKAVERVTLAQPIDGSAWTVIIQGNESLGTDIRRLVVDVLKGTTADERSANGVHSIYQFRFENDRQPTYMAILNQNSFSTIALSSNKKYVQEAVESTDEVALTWARPRRLSFNDSSIPNSLAKHEPKKYVMWGCVATQSKRGSKESLTNELGIVSFIGTVNLKESLDFDLHLEANRPKETLNSIIAIKLLIRTQLGKIEDPQIGARLLEFIEKIEVDPNPRTAKYRGIHIHRHMTPGEVAEFAKPFLSGLNAPK